MKENLSDQPPKGTFCGYHNYRLATSRPHEFREEAGLFRKFSHSYRFSGKILPQVILKLLGHQVKILAISS